MINFELDDTRMMQAYYEYLNDQGTEYEPEVLNIINRILTKDDVFVDCGAHVGFISLVAERVCKKVYAFEPETENYKYLVRNIELNDASVEALNYAVGDKNEEVELIINEDNDGGNCFWDVRKHPLNEESKKHDLVKQKVKMVTLDSVIKEPVKLIKIDVEGNELNVLKGAERIIKESSPTIILEINKFALNEMGTSQEEIIGFLKERGYKGYNLIDGKEAGLPDDVYNVIFLKVS